MFKNLNLATIIAIVSGIAGVAGSILTPIFGNALALQIESILQALSAVLVIIAGASATSVVHATAKAKRLTA